MANPKRLMQAATVAAMTSGALLVTIKAVAYFDTQSVAILSSLADSALDFFASLLTFFGVRWALTPADDGHRFGHGKAEPLVGLGQAAFITGSAAFVAIEAVSRLRHPAPIVEGAAGIIVMAIAIVITLALVTFQKYVVRKTGSLAIGGDSLHYTGDLLMNASVIVALLLSAFFGIVWADPVFGIAISGYLLFNAFQIGRTAVSGLMDHELSAEEREQIRSAVLKHPKVLRVHELRTRASGLQKFVQMHIVLDPHLTLLDAHRISEDVAKAIEAMIPGVDTIIHQDPDGIEEYHPRIGA
jgi:ferrous-iron efflux pump FieF